MKYNANLNFTLEKSVIHLIGLDRCYLINQGLSSDYHYQITMIINN